jgi:zinc D-Ala-D-Ala carboxypeptidase
MARRGDGLGAEAVLRDHLSLRSRRAAGYQARVAATFTKLGIPTAVARKRKLPLCVEAERLVVAEIGKHGRKHRLAPPAARAWKKMKTEAAKAGVGLQIVSAFRSFNRQVDIIRRKINEGQTIEGILRVSAPPGYSEHHTGCAIDIGTAGCDELEEIFEQSAAFSWLVDNASRYGYFMSYPRGNRHGYSYEPWHWMYRKA